MATDASEKPVEEVEEVSTESPKGEVELQRSFSAINEDSGAPWGGGIEGLTVKVGLLGADIDNLREGCQRLAGESEEIIQAIFERLGILHCRTSRIESVLGLPQWQPEEDEAERTEAEEGEEYSGPQCLRGHPLVPEEETDGPPKQCGFCRCQRQTLFKCSEDCYFHACQECVQQKAEEGRGAEAKPKDPAEGEALTPAQDAQGHEPTVEPIAEAATEGSSPSNTSDDAPRHADPKECRNSRPQTPSTASPEDATDTSGLEVDSTDGAEVQETESNEVQEPEQPEPTKPPKLPKETGLKARMCALEAEVRELAAYASSVAAKEAAALAQEVAAACCSDLHQEVLQMSAALKEDVKATVSQLKDGPRPQDSDPGLEEIGRCQEAFHQQFAEFAEAVEHQLLSNSQALQQFVVQAQEECEQRTATNVNAVEEKVEGLTLRLDVLEHELPRGRVRASKSSGKADKMDHEANALHYLANGFGALVKCLGLAKTTGELLGHHWPWEEVEQRIEEAWFQRGKEAWHLGLPPKPDLFDFLQCQAKAARLEAAKAPRLPDRREASRLANRLASTSPASCGTLSYSPQSSTAGTDARDVESEASPLRPRSAGGLGPPVSSSNPWQGRSSKGADMAWAEEVQDSRPLRATSSGAAQRFREVLMGRT